MEAALQRSGDYVSALHARPVLLPSHADVFSEGKGRRPVQNILAGVPRDPARVPKNPALLSDSSDSTDVLSKQGESYEDSTLKTDILALAHATRKEDASAYDAMLKAAIDKSEHKLAPLEAAQDLKDSQVTNDLSNADAVFAPGARTSSKRRNAVREAMLSAQRIEHEFHIKFDNEGNVKAVTLPPPPAVHGKHFIAGLGDIHKDNGLVSALFKHDWMPASKVESMAAPKVEQIRRRTRSRLTNHAVFKPRGVRRRWNSREPSAWGLVHSDAKVVESYSADVGADVADLVSQLSSGLTRRSDSRVAVGMADEDKAANSLWHYF